MMITAPTTPMAELERQARDATVKAAAARRKADAAEDVRDAALTAMVAGGASLYRTAQVTGLKRQTVTYIVRRELGLPTKSDSDTGT